MRLIRQLAEALQRIAGYNRKKDHANALAAIERAWGELLELPRDVIDVLDSMTLAEMLSEPDKIRIASQLLTEEAIALAGKGDPANAARCYRRAMELRLEARALASDPSDDAALLELSHHVHANQLDPRYRTSE